MALTVPGIPESISTAAVGKLLELLGFDPATAMIQSLTMTLNTIQVEVLTQADGRPFMEHIHDGHRTISRAARHTITIPIVPGS